MLVRHQPKLRDPRTLPDAPCSLMAAIEGDGFRKSAVALQLYGGDARAWQAWHTPPYEDDERSRAEPRRDRRIIPAQACAASADGAADRGDRRPQGTGADTLRRLGD